MKTTAETKIGISNERDYILVEASKLSLSDDFMSYEPIKTNFRMQKFKASLTEIIKNGIQDFYRPAMDPSFADEEKTKIHYMSGKRPAVGKSYNWWKETVKDSNFCLGTKTQYIAFLGVLIKKLVAEGWTVVDAWAAVCTDSNAIGHYWNSDDAKFYFEDTGSREICGFFDLGNTYKIFAEDGKEGAFWIAGGHFLSSGFTNALAHLELCYIDFNHVNGVGWLVLKKEH